MKKRVKLTLWTLLLSIITIFAGVITAQAATKVSVPKSLTIVAGFKETIEVYAYDTDDPDFEMDVTVKKWKSSNTKIATVNKSGVVTAKKAGKCKITYTVNGKSYSTAIKVKKNIYTDHSSYGVWDVNYSDADIIIRKAYYSGNYLVIKATVYYRRIFRMTKFDRLYFQFYNEETNKIYAQHQWKNVKCSMPGNSSKKITLKFKTKKKIDLTKNFAYGYNYVYTYVT